MKPPGEPYVVLETKHYRLVRIDNVNQNKMSKVVLDELGKDSLGNDQWHVVFSCDCYSMDHPSSSAVAETVAFHNTIYNLFNEMQPLPVLTKEELPLFGLALRSEINRLGDLKHTAKEQTIELLMRILKQLGMEY